MNYVYGRSTIAMDSANDRMRLKDKIVANVAKAVKSIQELHVLSGSRSVKLGNYDWQCHRLCEHIDHSLLHGLRHVTPGYWKIVTEFTHKDTVKHIKRMRNVTTDLGRGRAWLFTALNECLLESYMRCYQQNEKLVENYYVRDALVRDPDRFNVLLTVISGLENTEFEMECDMPYLDLCVYPPKGYLGTRNVEASVDYDRVSICSMESVHMPTKHLPQTVFEESNTSLYKPSDKSHDHTDKSADKLDAVSTGSGELTAGHLMRSPSPDSGIHSDWNFRQRSITPLAAQIHGNDDEVENGDDAFKVIHLSKKGKPQKKKKKRKFVSVSSIAEPDVGDIHEHHDGPVLEIPPIDDIKLTSAIMNNQNNNDLDFDTVNSESNDRITDAAFLPDVRMPGDGIDSVDSVSTNDGGMLRPSSARGETLVSSDGRRSRSVLADATSYSGANNASSPGNSRSITDHARKSTGDIYNANNTSDTSNMHPSATSGRKSISPPRHRKLSGRHNDGKQESTFTQLLEARVSDIVKSGEQIEQEELREAIDTDRPEDSEDASNRIFQYSKDNYGIVDKHKEIYGADEISDMVENNPEQVPKASSVKLVPEIDSIYSRAYNSDDEKSDEDSESVSGEVKTSSRSNATPSRLSQKSGSSSGMSKGFRSTQSTPGYGKSAIPSPFYESDSPFYGLPSSDRETPDSYSANQIRSKSVMSSLSANEKARSRPHSKASTNESEGFRDSPYAAPDEDRISHRSLSSNQSPSHELEGSNQQQQQVLQAKVEELIVQRRLNQYTHLTFGEEDADWEESGEEGRRAESRNSLRTPDITRNRTASLSAGEVELDNNARLYLMLDILTSEDEHEETIVKMFCCRQGHTEGKTETVYVLVTSSSLYLLQRPQGKKKFSQLAAVPFTDIDFVSIGYNNQILNIACKTKRQQYWLTTGEERTTICLVDCLASSVENCQKEPGRLVVDTGNTRQRIALQKYITQECRCEMEEAEVVCYSLVHWEDPSCDTGASCEWDRDGTLWYKSNETTGILGTQTWRLGHAVLKDGMLCLYKSKGDSKPAHFLSLIGGQCVGCKRDFNADKNNVVRIILQDSTYWSIALDTEPEANNWLQGLCQAVSEGMKMNSTSVSCGPCCLVLSRFKLHMCLEDLETNFVRTLGSANLHDVTSVLVDDINKTYIVLAFESDDSNIENDKWVLYFNSEHECQRFKTALAECWFKLYEVHVPELPLEDFTLQRRCTEMTRHLKETLSL